jgi:hypothetical protein
MITATARIIAVQISGPMPKPSQFANQSTAVIFAIVATVIQPR